MLRRMYPHTMHHCGYVHMTDRAPPRYHRSVHRPHSLMPRASWGRPGILTIDDRGLCFRTYDLFRLVSWLLRRQPEPCIAPDDIVAFRLEPMIPAFWIKQARFEVLLSNQRTMHFIVTYPDQVRRWMKRFRAVEYG